MILEKLTNDTYIGEQGELRRIVVVDENRAGSGNEGVTEIY